VPEPRVFHLQRDHDVSGVSGTGRVADGVLWPDGTVTIRWRGDRPSTVNWDRLADAEHVHGHQGATRIIWADEAVPGSRPSDDHDAVYVDDEGLLYSEYRTAPRTDEVYLLRLVWANEMAQSKAELERQGVVFRHIGWSR
jgi:hypothetical protein